MVRESRSLLIQQLFRGGFEEDDDDDEDEDEAHELMNRHPSNDESQDLGRKEHAHQELTHGDLEAGRLHNKDSKDDATSKQVFDSNVVNRHNLLASTEPWKDPQAEFQNADGDCLHSEKEIIELGSKKLVTIHSEFLVRQYNPPLQPFKEPAQQEPETTSKDSNCFSNICHKQQQLKGGEGLNPSLGFTPSKLLSENKEENDHMVLGEAQQSYGSVEDALLSTQRAFTSPVSPEEEERSQRCFAVLSNAKTAARELNANISIPVFSTGFEKKSSISGCTESLASDRGSSTDSVNGGDEVIQDVTSVEKAFKCDERKGDQFNTLRSPTNERITVEAAVSIARVEEVVQQVESTVPVIELETAQIGENRGSETTNRIKDWPIETTAEYRQAENEKPFSHVFEKSHVEFLSKVYKTDSSNVAAVEESPSRARLCSGMFMNSRKHSALFVHLDVSEEKAKEIEAYKTAPTTMFPPQDVSTALHCFAVSHGAAEPANLIHARRAEERTGEAVEKVLQQQDVLSASDNLKCNIKETGLTELPLKRCADTASLRTCLSEEVNRGDDPVVAAGSDKDAKSLEKVDASEKDDTFMISSPMASPKLQLADTAHPDAVRSPGKEVEMVMYTSSEGKLRSPVDQATAASLNEGPVHVSPPVQKSSTVQADRRGLTVEPYEVDITPTTTSPQAVEMPLCPTAESLPPMPTSPLAAAAPVNKRSKSNEKAGTSKKSKKKKARVQHQDARTMVFVRSDTRVAYNNRPHFASNTDHSNPQEVSQHNAVVNIMNPSYDFVGSPQSGRAAAFMSHETDVHLMQAQTSAKDAMVAATSALGQSHCEWSRMQSQVPHSRLRVMRESQIAAIAASVAAAAVVAKAAVEAARAIQEVSKEYLGQLGGPSQPNFGNSGFARSAEMLAHGRGYISEMTNFQTVEFPNPTKINTAGRKKQNRKPGASSANSKDELLIARSRKKTFKFMKQEVVTDDQKMVGAGVCKKRTIHDMNQPQRMGPSPTSHAELRDPGGGVFGCTKGASTGHEPDELVEVMTEEAGLQGGWFVAKVLMKTDREAFVQYNELIRDDGCTPRRDLFPLSSFREEGAYGRTQQGDWQWLRPLHPFSKTWKVRDGSILPQTWTVGNHVDAYRNGGWWEGVVVGIDKSDETNVKIHFSAGKGIQTMRAWDVRPSLIWTGDDWRPWNDNLAIKDEPSSKRPKLDADDNTLSKEKMQSLKKFVDSSCKPISDSVAGPRVSLRSAEAAARKNGSGSIKLDALNTRRVGFTSKNVGHKTNHAKQASRKRSRSASVTVHSTSCGNLASSKKTAACSTSSPAPLAARDGTVSTRLQLKAEAEKRRKLSNLVVSKVIQKGVKSISTRSDTMKPKSKTIPSKLLQALKTASKKKPPHPSHKK